LPSIITEILIPLCGNVIAVADLGHAKHFMELLTHLGRGMMGSDMSYFVRQNSGHLILAARHGDEFARDINSAPGNAEGVSRGNINELDFELYAIRWKVLRQAINNGLQVDGRGGVVENCD